VLADEVRDVIYAAQHRHAHDLPADGRLAIHKADYAIAQARHLPYLLQDHAPHLACADDEQPVGPHPPLA
jgi:hypothetical protein